MNEENFQYYHGMKHKMIKYSSEFTVATFIPEASAIQDAANASFSNPSATWSIPVGVSHVSEKDNYCRKVGRQISKSRMSAKELHLSSCFYGEGFVNFHFTYGETLQLIFQTKPGRSKAYLIHAEYWGE